MNYELGIINPLLRELSVSVVHFAHANAKPQTFNSEIA